MKKVALIGHFGFGLNYVDGQTVKTKNLYNLLYEKFGRENVICFDTHGRWKALLSAPFVVLKALKEADNVIILPAYNGLLIYAPLLVLLKNFFYQKTVHYVVIGGWLYNYTKSNTVLSYFLNRLDYIYVETKQMKIDLDSLGFTNILLMPNFKILNILCKESLSYEHNKPYNLCTLCRVMKNKGIEDAVEVVQKINNKYGRVVCKLDIYGPIDSNEEEWFRKLSKNFPYFIKYKGVISPDNSINIIKDYFLLLFPTKFYTEGIPGTILDAYASGVPVLASKWINFDDIIEDNYTGWGYEFGNQNDFMKVLEKIINNPNLVFSIKENCLEKANYYSPEEICKTLMNNI